MAIVKPQGRPQRHQKGIKPSAKVCRNLFGPVDHDQLQLELKQQQQQLETVNRDRWNFDFKTETPLSGAYVWEKVDVATEGVPEAYRLPYFAKTKRRLDFSGVTSPDTPECTHADVSRAVLGARGVPGTPPESPSPCQPPRPGKRRLSVIGCPGDEENRPAGPATPPAKRKRKLQTNRKITDFMPVRKTPRTQSPPSSK